MPTMNKLIKSTERYRDCIGSIEWSEEDGLYHGRITSGVCPGDFVTYEAADEAGIQREFKGAVDDYFELRAELPNAAEKTTETCGAYKEHFPPGCGLEPGHKGHHKERER